MYTFSFEKLEVWIRSKSLTNQVYRLTQNFLDIEKFGVVTQVRRAVISVCSNIAEGSSRRSARDQSHFYNLSFSSLMEVLNQLIISQELGYININDLNDLRNEIHTISLMINRLNNYAMNKSLKSL